ncbi:MAG TPA: response regulator, partial [Acidothermaceae bacterium]
MTTAQPDAELSASARILVVDDDPTVSDVVGRYLRRAGYDVTLVGDGLAAVEWAEHNATDLVVLDIMLPGLDGLAVCRRLRQRGSVPVILLTALGAETDRIMGLEVGADDYVTKPFSPRELVLRVASVLR